MIINFLNKIKAERIDPEDFSTAPFFYQQQKVYSFCRKYVKNKVVLEVGSGSGYGTYHLSKFAKKIIAIDKDSGSIKESEKRYKSKNITFIPSTIEAYKTHQKFDIIIMLQVMEHILEIHSFLEKILFLLKKNGLVILSTPNALTQSYNENPYHHKEFNSTELRNLLSGYFKRVNLYGLHGDRKICEYEQMRKKQVLSILSKDPWNVRRFIPRIIRKYIFDIISFSRKNITKVKTNNYYNSISENNFIISQTELNKSIDLIAISKQAK